MLPNTGLLVHANTSQCELQIIDRTQPVISPSCLIASLYYKNWSGQLEEEVAWVASSAWWMSDHAFLQQTHAHTSTTMFTLAPASRLTRQIRRNNLSTTAQGRDVIQIALLLDRSELRCWSWQVVVTSFEYCALSMVVARLVKLF